MEADVGPKVASKARGFTLTELMVVVGLIAVLISLLLPALGKAKAAANATACLANLKQLGTAWTIYVTENRGRLPDDGGPSFTIPDLPWRVSWLGIMESNKVS